MVVVDTTLPALTVPGPITTNATKPAGAEVVYAVSGTDIVDPNPTIACAPASGSTFPVGTTVVACTATDARGNATGASFFVSVRGASDQVVALIEATVGLSLPPALKATLTAALQTALGNPRNLAVACASLNLYIRVVQTQVGRAIPVETTNGLIADARPIKAVLGCSG